MNIFYLITGNGSLLIMTSFPALDDPSFLKKLAAKGIEKFLAYNIPVDIARQWYGGHFEIVAQDLQSSGDLRVLDYNGGRIFEKINFTSIGHPYIYANPLGGTEIEKKAMRPTSN